MVLLWTQCISNRLAAASFGFTFAVISVSCQRFGSLQKNNQSSVLPFASSCVSCLFFWWALRFLTSCITAVLATCRFYWGQTFWNWCDGFFEHEPQFVHCFRVLQILDLRTSWVQFFSHLVPFCLLVQVDPSWFLVAFIGSYVTSAVGMQWSEIPGMMSILLILPGRLVQGVSLIGWVFNHLGHFHVVKQILESVVRCRGTSIWLDSSIFPVHAWELEIIS